MLPSVEPGYLRQMLPKAAPYRRESWDEIMPDIERCIIPGVSSGRVLSQQGHFSSVDPVDGEKMDGLPG